MTAKPRKSASQNQLAFDYPKPDTDIPESAPQAIAKGTSKQPGKKRQAAREASLQASLPGLSRRGRPRLKNPVPAATRASASRKRRLEAGMKRLEFMFDEDAAADLDRLQNHFKLPKGEIVIRLIRKAAKRLPEA